MPKVDKMPYTTAIILAGGSGRRMQSELTKQRMTLSGMSVLKRSVLAFEGCDNIKDIIVVVRIDEIELFQQELSGLKKVRCVCPGGDTRAESARRGFMHVSADAEYVAIHDAARPLIKPSDITRVLNVAIEKGAAFAAAPVYDTVKVIDSTSKVVSTPKRNNLVRATTPQIFEKKIYERALAMADGLAEFTDDNMMVERMGKEVYAVVLDNENPKLTTKDDIKLFELLLSER